MSARLPTKRRRGPPSKRTPEMAGRICHFVAKGLPFIHCAAASGISQSALCAWRAEDLAFEAKIQKAIARGVAKRLAKIEAASKGDWRAAAWLLEHCQPQHFAVSRQLLEVSGPNGSPLAGMVAIMLPPKADGNGNGSPVVNVPALPEGRPNGNGH